MNEQNKIILTQLKGELLFIFKDIEHDDFCDIEQFEYLIQLIDYMLLDKIPVVKNTIKAFMEEIINTSIYGMRQAVLKTLYLVDKLKGDFDDSEISLY